MIDTVLTNATPADPADDFDAILVPANTTLTGIADRAGYPQLTVPAGYDLDATKTFNPVNVSFVGTAFSEARLLADAYAFEQRDAACGWRRASRTRASGAACRAARSRRTPARRRSDVILVPVASASQRPARPPCQRGHRRRAGFDRRPVSAWPGERDGAGEGRVRLLARLAGRCRAVSRTAPAPRSGRTGSAAAPVLRPQGRSWTCCAGTATRLQYPDLSPRAGDPPLDPAGAHRRLLEKTKPAVVHTNTACRLRSSQSLRRTRTWRPGHLGEARLQLGRPARRAASGGAVRRSSASAAP